MDLTLLLRAFFHKRYLPLEMQWCEVYLDRVFMFEPTLLAVTALCLLVMPESRPHILDRPMRFLVAFVLANVGAIATARAGVLWFAYRRTYGEGR